MPSWPTRPESRRRSSTRCARRVGHRHVLVGNAEAGDGRHQLVDRSRALGPGDVGGERVRHRARPSAARIRGRARPSTRPVPRSSSGSAPSSRPRPSRRSFPRRRRTPSARRASGTSFGSRGSGSMRTRSLQSPPVLVNPHATWPLLPTTRLGNAGQRDAGDALVWPRAARRIGKDHRRAIPDDRHADRQVHVVGDKRAPTALCAPSTAQLLLPMIVGF